MVLFGDVVDPLKQVIGLAEVGLWGLAFKSYTLTSPLAQTLSDPSRCSKPDDKLLPPQIKTPHHPSSAPT